jgi:hypothetical protein
VRNTDHGVRKETMNKESIKNAAVGLCRLLPKSGLSYEEGIVALKTAIEILSRTTAETDVDEMNMFIDNYVTSSIQKVN